MNEGFSNWKHSLEKGRGIIGHATSIPHTCSSRIYMEYQMRTATQRTVVEVYDSARLEFVQRNRAKICKITSALHFCAWQSIALRGHDEGERYKILSLIYCSIYLFVCRSSNRGNFMELLLRSAGSDSTVQALLEDASDNASYTSPEVQYDTKLLNKYEFSFDV